MAISPTMVEEINARKNDTMIAEADRLEKLIDGFLSEGRVEFTLPDAMPVPVQSILHARYTTVGWSDVVFTCLGVSPTHVRLVLSRKRSFDLQTVRDAGVAR